MRITGAPWEKFFGDGALYPSEIQSLGLVTVLSTSEVKSHKDAQHQKSRIESVA